MLKALSVIFLILGWLLLLNTPLPKEIYKSNQFKISLMLLAIGTVITFSSFVK